MSETLDPIGDIRRIREMHAQEYGHREILPDHPLVAKYFAQQKRAKLITWLFAPLWLPLAVIAIVLLFISAVVVLPFCGGLYWP